MFARGSLKKLYRDDLSARGRASARASQALYDAADDDSATGGPDLTRRIFPVVAVVDADGFRRLPDDEVGGASVDAPSSRAAHARTRRPDRPRVTARARGLTP